MFLCTGGLVLPDENFLYHNCLLAEQSLFLRINDPYLPMKEEKSRCSSIVAKDLLMEMKSVAVGKKW